ncbi:hypothetical protein Dolphis_35 [Pseudomonas phage Dolphis]|nr:hypothetical protein Dolphis_35 [Pseudomonas phage Dolphis]
MIDDRTEHLDLPLPHVDNDLSFDVERIRAALVAIDAAIADLRTAVSPPTPDE